VLFQELNLDVSTEELLNSERAFTYADLYAMLGNVSMVHTVLWLTPHAAVALENGSAIFYWQVLHDSYRFHFSADGKGLFVFARSPEHLLEIVDVVVRLLAASIVHSVIIDNWSGRDYISINATRLAYLMEQCQSLKLLTLKDLNMDEANCRVLDAYSRPDLDIVLSGCAITDTGAITLAEVLGRNEGPTKLHRCRINNLLLVDGLRGNSRLKILRPSFSNLSNRPDDGNRELLAIAGALRENKGLVDLNLSWGLRVNDDTWKAICASLETHPTLEVLHLYPTSVPAEILFQIQALVDMMKVNTSIHTILMDPRYSQHELYRESVIPYLETNRFRPRLLAIQQTRPIPYRAKVLGRALLSTRTNTNHFWMLLSGNAEVAFPSSTLTIAAAASFLTPAAVGASANAATVKSIQVATDSPAADARGEPINSTRNI
jgi:hypothetical protein